MCFDSLFGGKTSTPTVQQVAPAPTAVSTGEDQAVKDARENDRKRQRAAAGFQNNILTGSTSSTGSVTKNQLLGQ